MDISLFYCLFALAEGLKGRWTGTDEGALFESVAY